nr:oligosaccharide flippase family protein [Mycobacterium sp.]
MRALNEIVRQVFIVLFGRGIVYLAQFVTFLIFARLMSPDEFGWFGIVTTGITLACLLGGSGLRQSFGYEIGQKLRTPGEAAGTALGLWLPIALACAAAVYLPYGRQLPGLSDVESGAIIVVGVAALLLVFLMQGVSLGRGDIGAYSTSEAVPRVASMILAIVLALTAGVTLQSALWAQSAGFVLAAPAVSWLARRGAGRLRINLRGLGDTFRFGMTFAINLLLITLCSRLSMFVIEHYRGAAAAGEFFAAARVNEIFLEAATAVGLVLFSNAARQDNSLSVLNRNARIGCWMFWLFMAFSGVVALAAPSLMTLLAGSEYAAAGPALQILALSLAPTAATKVIYPSLSGSGHPHFGTPAIVIGLAVTTGLAIALVPSMGVNGGALALVLGQYVLFAGYVVTCRFRFDIPLRDLLLPRWEDTKRSWRLVSSRLSREG